MCIVFYLFLMDKLFTLLMLLLRFFASKKGRFINLVQKKILRCSISNDGFWLDLNHWIMYVFFIFLLPICNQIKLDKIKWGANKCTSSQNLLLQFNFQSFKSMSRMKDFSFIFCIEQLTYFLQPKHFLQSEY